MLQINDLTVRYMTSNEDALKCINFEASKGEFVVFAGPSGSGKSTLAQVLMTLIPNFTEADISGEISYNGISFKDLTREKLVSLLGYVPQYPSDFTISLLVEEEIVFLLENLALDSEEIISRLNQVLAELEISSLQRRVIPELSSGELQRVFLASALAFAPPIIILDEPIARIDPKTEVKLVELLRKLADNGHLVIAFEHRLDYIVTKADRLVILKKGKIVSDEHPLDNISLLEDIDPPELSLIDFRNKEKVLALEDQVDSKRIVSKIRNANISELLKLENGTPSDTAISLNHVNFRYNNKTDWILKDVDLQLKKGESIGLMGINGCGKSTLMKVILGIVKARKGEVWINGRKIKNVRKGKKDCIYVPENAKLFLVGPTPLRDLERQLRDNEEVIEIYNKFKMQKLMKRKLYHLSEGERRLFALINSFYFQEDIILLDEPTIALDKKGRRILLELVETAKENGNTVILATNDPRIVTSLDRLVVIENGDICLDGPPRKVLYELEKHTNLIPNQTVRYIQKLEKETGISLPRILNPKEFNFLLKEAE
ncbi:MAG: ATP-binding cassette domain-containing protein [Candidatus Heimdallarchaeota archaeon]|nr:ATP-binding cassette domain-containing protein [Candidatus Heimdallarchaeota archaeon]